MDGRGAGRIAIAVLLPCLIPFCVFQAAAQEQPGEKAEIEQLISKLGDDDWNVREGATQELIKKGKPAIPLLIRAVISGADAETKIRCGTALSGMEVELSDEEIARIESMIGECKDAETGEILWNSLRGAIGGLSKGLRLFMKLDKKVYERGKDAKIAVSAVLENRLEQDLPLCTGFNVSRLPKAHYRFEIEGPHGAIEATRRSSDFDLGEVGEEHFVKVKPGERWNVSPKGWFDLSGKAMAGESSFYFSSLERDDTSLVWVLGEPGRYKLSLVYSNDNDGSPFGLKAWTGEVRSNTVVFEIK